MLRPITAALLTLALAGCLAAPRYSVSSAPFHLGHARLIVLPIDDPDHALTPAETQDLQAFAARSVTESAGPVLVSATADAEYALHLRVDAFHDASPVLALVVGFGEGRAGYDVEARIERARASSDDPPLASARLERERYSYESVPQGPRPTMLRELETALDRFIRRHR